jgi:hypothetical protein
VTCTTAGPQGPVGPLGIMGESFALSVMSAMVSAAKQWALRGVVDDDASWDIHLLAKGEITPEQFKERVASYGSLFSDGEWEALKISRLPM